MSLLTLVSAVIFLSFGVTVLLYLLRTILGALPWGNPFTRLGQVRVKSAVENNKKLLAQLQASQRSGELELLKETLIQVAQSRSANTLFIEEIPSLSELALTVLDCGVFLLEETGARFSELPRFEELVQTRHELLSKLQEVLNIKNRLTRRGKEGEKPKEWAVKEISSQEKELRAQLGENSKEVKTVILKLIEVSKKPSTHSNHKYH